MSKFKNLFNKEPQKTTEHIIRITKKSASKNSTESWRVSVEPPELLESHEGQLFLLQCMGVLIDEMLDINNSTGTFLDTDEMLETLGFERAGWDEEDE